MDPLLLVLAVVLGGGTLIIFGFLVMFSRFYRKVKQGEALIVSTTKKVEVSFTGRLVLPVVHRAEVMDISLKTIEIDRHGKDGLICADNIRADIRVTFFIRVNESEKEVLKVAKNVGCDRASSQDTLEELFGAKFSEALKTAGKQMEFKTLFTDRIDFRDKILSEIGEDLNGYVLEDAAIDYLEQTPLEHLDPNNVLDAQGRRKIVEETSEQIEAENQRKNKRDMIIGSQNLDRKNAMMKYERDEAAERSMTERMMREKRAQENAMASKVEAEQRAIENQAKQESEKIVNIAAIQKANEEQRAELARERDIAIERENIQKAVRLEALDREQTIELREFAKTKEVEVKRKEIAFEIRERISVEKTVAEEEEHIKDLRAMREAERNKKVRVTNAEGVAQEKLVVNIKAAEADEKVAKHKAAQRLTMADAELQESDKKAKAKIRLAEGVQAETAAEGLARAKVKEAEAIALEKEGLAKAKVQRESMLAEAKGKEEHGMAQARVKQAHVDLIEREGKAEAMVIQEKHQAEAKGTEEKGMADIRVKQATIEALEKEGLAKARIAEEQGMAQAKVKEATAAATQKEMFAEAKGTEEKGMAGARIKEADAAALEKRLLVEAKGTEEQGLAEVRIREADAKAIELRGSAEASAIAKRGEAEAVGVREKLVAEASGLAEKANAMKLLDDISRAHEEFRLRLEHERAIRIEGIHAERDIAKSRAAILGEAFKSANVDIIGGDGEFFERYLNAASMGRSIDGFFSGSKSASTALGGYLDGSQSLPDDVKQLVANLPIGSQDIQRLTISAFLGNLMTGADDTLKTKLSGLIDQAKQLGVGDVPISSLKSDD